MSTKPDDSCPVCADPTSCKGYPHLWKKLREEIARPPGSPTPWRAIHDRLNESDVERAARLIAEHPPDGKKRGCCG